LQITARMVETLEFLPLQRRLSPVPQMPKGIHQAAARCGRADRQR
jgi:hypothetical protein